VPCHESRKPGRVWIVLADCHRAGLGVLALALAGIFVRQRRRPESAATLPTDSATFGVVIVGTALLVGALTYLPVLAMGPIIEQLRL